MIKEVLQFITATELLIVIACIGFILYNHNKKQ